MSKAALAAGSVILSAYVPALTRAALAGLAAIAANPFALMAIAVAGATYALAEFGDKIHPIAGDMANLQDYAAAAWDTIKHGAQIAAATVNGAFVEVVQVIAHALDTGANSFGDLSAFAIRTADVVIGAFRLMYETIVITFTKLPAAVAEVVLDAVNGLIAAVEAGLNAVVHGVNAAVSAINSVGGKVGRPSARSATFSLAGSRTATRARVTRRAKPT